VGFHRRYIKKDDILNNLSNIDTYLNTNLILDNWSNEFYKDLSPNHRKIRNRIVENQKLVSGCPDTNLDYIKLESLSESLIFLSTNPNWVDIHFVKTKLGLITPIEISGKFDEQVNFCITEIINYYNNKIK
jgi:hypothetical protein